MLALRHTECGHMWAPQMTDWMTSGKLLTSLYFNFLICKHADYTGNYTSLVLSFSEVEIPVYPNKYYCVYLFNIKINKKTLQLNIVWRPDRDYSCHITKAELHRKKTDTSSFLERTQPMISHRYFVYHSCSNLLFFSKSVRPFPCSVGILHVACHDFESQNAILCWSKKKPMLVKNYVAVYIF